MLPCPLLVILFQFRGKAVEDHEEGSEDMKCSRCGSQLPEGTGYCSICGIQNAVPPRQETPQYGAPPQGMPPYGMPPQGVPQNGMPPQGAPYQGVPQYGQAPPYAPGGYGPGPGFPGPVYPPLKKKSHAALIVIIIIILVFMITAGTITGILLLKRKGGDGRDISEDGPWADINIPKGAEIVDDAEVSDLAGEYRGELRISSLEGLENIPGLDLPPIAMKGIMTVVRSRPLDCTLEIWEDGSWEMSIDMIEGFTIGSNSMAKGDSFLIEDVDEGYYRAVVNSVGDDSGECASGMLENKGAYYTRNGKKMIAGKLSANMNYGGGDMVLSGDFNVEKISED